MKYFIIFELHSRVLVVGFKKIVKNEIVSKCFVLANKNINTMYPN